MPSKKSQPSKHPRTMTTAEAVEHLFHPDVVKHLKNEANKLKPKRLKKS
jgi:hypothetical protein